MSVQRDQRAINEHNIEDSFFDTVRCALYMTVISALKSNPKIQTFYQRLREKGKKAKVAITACIRKFVIILNAILRNAYENNLILT